MGTKEMINEMLEEIKKIAGQIGTECMANSVNKTQREESEMIADWKRMQKIIRTCNEITTRGNGVEQNTSTPKQGK